MSATLSGSNGEDEITEDVEFTFYHCRQGSFYNGTNCVLCTNPVTGDNEVMGVITCVCVCVCS